jgi:hypothetical protein
VGSGISLRATGHEILRFCNIRIFGFYGSPVTRIDLKLARDALCDIAATCGGLEGPVEVLGYVWASVLYLV